MSVSNGIISAPVSISDIQNAIGTSGGGDLATLCKSNNINMWAKWKPVPKTIIDTTAQLDGSAWKTDAQLNDPWWRGNDGNYGLALPTIYSATATDDNGIINALNSLATTIDGDNNGWRYLRPGGGSNQPYRQLDFLKYNHRADKPIKRLSWTEMITAVSQVWSQMVIPMESADIAIATRDYVRPTDITSMTLNIGFAIYKKSGSTYTAIAWVTGTNWEGKGINTASGSDGATVWPQEYKVEANFKDGTTYYILPVYFNRSMDQPAAKMSLNNVNVKMVAVPCVGFKPFVCYRVGQTVGYPELSNHNPEQAAGATLARYSTNFMLDSTLDGYSGGSASVRVLIVNQLWDGSYDVSPQSDACVYNQTFSFTQPTNAVYTFGSSGIVWLNSAYSGWKVVVVVNSVEYQLAIRQPVPPSQ